jgi:hypothetical protein
VTLSGSDGSSPDGEKRRFGDLVKGFYSRPVRRS